MGAGQDQDVSGRIADMSHLHGIGFRLIGEIFSVLQDSREVVLSAYTQRNNPVTGMIQEEFLKHPIYGGDRNNRVTPMRLDRSFCIVTCPQ